MRRIAITTPNVMAALRRLNRDQSPTVQLRFITRNRESVRVSGYIAWAFEKDSARWREMPYINIHDGKTHT